MKSAPDHPQEEKRLAKLDEYQILDSEQEAHFDELTELASAICSAPISLISFVDDHRQWFKSQVGLEAQETPKNIAFCSHAILEQGVFEIPDAAEDARFFDNPLVTGSPDIRFYAGAPLIAPNGSPVGTLCVIDTEPRKLTDDQTRALQILSNQVVSQLELRKQKLEIENSYKQQQKMLASIAHDLRAPFSGILGLSEQLSRKVERMSQQRIVKASRHILSSSLRVYQLLDEMLQWSTQRMGKNQISKTAQALLPLAESSYDLLEEALSLKEIQYSCDINPKIKVLADTTLTKTIIRNLLNNAIKFCPEGGTIKVSARATDNAVNISLFNTGEPIPEDQQQQLFCDNCDSKDGTNGETGTGLGLFLCHEFARAQQGEIWYEAQENGSNFTFSLPIATAS